MCGHVRQGFVCMCVCVCVCIVTMQLVTELPHRCKIWIWTLQNNHIVSLADLYKELTSMNKEYIEEACSVL